MAKIARRRLASFVAQQLSSGASVKPLANQIVALLIEERRTGELELLIRDIETALSTEYGVVTLHITTAHSLDDTLRTQLREFVAAATKAKEIIVTDEQIDERLIGGAVLRTPTGVFDSSVQSQLKQLRSNI